MNAADKWNRNDTNAHTIYLVQRDTTQKRTNRKGNPLEFRWAQVDFDYLKLVSVLLPRCCWTSPREPPGSSTQFLCLFCEKKNNIKFAGVFHTKRPHHKVINICKVATHRLALITLEFTSDRKRIGGSYRRGHAGPWLVRLIIISHCANVPPLSPQWVSSLLVELIASLYCWIVWILVDACQWASKGTAKRPSQMKLFLSDFEWSTMLRFRHFIVVVVTASCAPSIALTPHQTVILPHSIPLEKYTIFCPL